MMKYTHRKLSSLLSCGVIALLIPLIVNYFTYAADVPIWVEADGEACMSEIDTPKEVSARAKKDAQVKAIEKAVGVFINAHTLVYNSQLAEDLIYASVRGKIEKVSIITEGWDEKVHNLYRVKIKALIKPVYPERGEGISLKLSLSKADLKEGEEVKIFYQANCNCYVYIFSVAADGSVTLLVPNSMYRENFVRANKVYELPPPGSQWRLQAMFLPDFEGKEAEERIKIIATKKQEELVPLGFQEGMFKVYDAKSTGMISDLIKKLNQLDPGEWSEATVVYRIER